jgi:hypothetical protein
MDSFARNSKDIRIHLEDEQVAVDMSWTIGSDEKLDDGEEVMQIPIERFWCSVRAGRSLGLREEPSSAMVQSKTTLQQPSKAHLDRVQRDGILDRLVVVGPCCAIRECEKRCRERSSAVAQERERKREREGVSAQLCENQTENLTWHRCDLEVCE